MRRRALGVLVCVSLLAPGLGAEGAPRPVEFPAPELPVTVAPMPLGVTRLPIEPPAPPPAPAPAVELTPPPLPRFQTMFAKPLPAVKDPGGTTCTFAFGRAAQLAECGVHRVLGEDLRGARDALEESLQKEPRGPQAGAASLWLGEVALREGRFDEAERRYRAALALTLPADLPAHAALGVGWTALRRGDFPAAQRAFAQARTLGPPEPLALVARFLEGVTWLSAGRAAEAQPFWDAVIAGGPPPTLADELLFWRGIGEAALGQPDQAIQTLDRFLASAPPKHPLVPDAILHAGWAALARGVPDDAVRRFLWAQSAGARAELVPPLRAGLVRAYLATGDSGRARETARLLTQESSRNPLAPPVLQLVAEDAARRGAVAEAVQDYRQLLALQLTPSLEAYATYRVGELLERQGRMAEAKWQYRTLRDKGRDEAIAQRAAYRLGLHALRERDPASARTEGEALLRAGVVPEVRELAILLAAEGAARGEDPNRAVVLFRLLLRDYPASPRVGEARLALGWVLLRDGDPEAALRAWLEATLAADLEIAALAHVAIAELSLREGREPQALQALSELVKLAPAHPLSELISLDRGILSVRAGAYAAAAQELEALLPRVTVPARQVLVRRAVGLARYHLRQFDAAETQFRQAALGAPAEPSNWLGVGLAALAQNRLPEAEEALNRARSAAAREVSITASYARVLVAAKQRDEPTFRERAMEFVDRYPGHPYTGVVLYGLVGAAADRGDVDQTDAWVKRLLKEPQSEYVGDALLRLAEVAGRERPTVARQAYRDFLQSLPKSDARADARLGLAEAAIVLGEFGEAQQALEGFLAEAPVNDPRGPRAFALLIRAHEVQGQRDRAIAAADAFLRRFPGDPVAPRVQLTRGHLLLLERRWDAAKEALEAARDAGDALTAAAAHVWLGELYTAQNDPEAAIAAYLGATYLYPAASPWADRGLQQAVQSYLSRQMPREAAILLRKLLARPGIEPALATWARQALAQLGPVTGEDPARRLRPGAPRP